MDSNPYISGYNPYSPGSGFGAQGDFAPVPSDGDPSPNAGLGGINPFGRNPNVGGGGYSPISQNLSSGMGQYARGGLVDAAERLKRAGRYGDSELVHVNPIERQIMERQFGPATVNPDTGLPEHFLPFLMPLLAAGAKAAVPSIIGSIAGGLASRAMGGGGKQQVAGIGGGVAPSMETLRFAPMRRETVPISFDPSTYGQRGGAFNFFKPYAFQEMDEGQAEGPGYAPPMKAGGEVKDHDDSMMGHLMAYAKNGGHQGSGQVRGIGSGQDDKIPAWLSDGEYVWSAQDVSDLGDGSTDEGVRRLDQMRHMVRKQAGRKDVKKIAKPQRGIDHMLKAVGGAA